jgi:hypothetical protein
VRFGLLRRRYTFRRRQWIWSERRDIGGGSNLVAPNSVLCVLGFSLRRPFGDAGIA